MEERIMRESDWAYEVGQIAADQKETSKQPKSSKKSKKDSAARRELEKQAYNAPRRIAKLEKLIEKAELSLSAVEKEMMENGNDAAILMKLTDQRSQINEQIMAYMQEWESLQELLQTAR